MNNACAVSHKVSKITESELNPAILEQKKEAILLFVTTRHHDAQQHTSYTFLFLFGLIATVVVAVVVVVVVVVVFSMYLCLWLCFNVLYLCCRVWYIHTLSMVSPQSDW